MDVVVADVAPGRRLQARLGERAAVEREDVVQALVGHGHVAAQLGDGGVRAATLVDEHVHALRHGVAEEDQALAVDLGARDPGRVLGAARGLEHLAQAVELGGRLVLGLAVELHVDADGRVLGELRQRREGRRGLALAAQDIERAGVEVLDRRGAGKRGAGLLGEVERGLLGGKEAAHAPHDGGRGHERDLDPRDDAERAARADEEVDGVHVVGHVVARGVLRRGHPVRGQVEHELAARLGDQAQDAAVCADLAAAQHEQVAVGERNAQRRHVRARGAVLVAAGTRGVAGHDAAHAGRGLGRVRGEELLGSRFEGLERGERRVVPARVRDGLRGEVFAQLREHDARLHGQVERPVGVLTHAQVAGHAAHVEHVAAVRDRAGRETRARALHRHRRAGGVKLAQDVAHLLLGGREADALRFSRAARLVAAIFLEFFGKRPDLGHGPSPLAGVCGRNASACARPARRRAPLRNANATPVGGFEPENRIRRRPNRDLRNRGRLYV